MELNIHTSTQPEEIVDPLIGKIIFNKYKILKYLGGGTFGSIYSAIYDNKYYAVKFEDKKTNDPLLQNECYIMTSLRSPYLPNIKMLGYNNTHNILVMELMGKSLAKIFEDNNEKPFSTRCVCNIGYQMIEILEFIHDKNYVHRDIKPDNFVIGLNKKRKYIFILDFGLSKKYRSSKTNKHYPPCVYKNLVGTPRYASINALGGLTQSRRDDLESVGYVLLYFLRGKLPWQGIKAKNKEERNNKIMFRKKTTTAEELCYGFHDNFVKYINYTRNLEYEQDPDYNYLKKLFLSMLISNGFFLDCFYDWDNETIIYKRNQNNSFIGSVIKPPIDVKDDNNNNFSQHDNNRPNLNNIPSSQKIIGINNNNQSIMNNNAFLNIQDDNIYNKQVKIFNENIAMQNKNPIQNYNINNNYNTNPNKINKKYNKAGKNCECCIVF